MMLGWIRKSSDQFLDEYDLLTLLTLNASTTAYAHRLFLMSVTVAWIEKCEGECKCEGGI